MPAQRANQQRVDAVVTDHDLGVAGTGAHQLAISFDYVVTEGGVEVHRQITHYMGLSDTVSPGKEMSAWDVTQKALDALGWSAQARDWNFKELAAKSAQNPVGGALVGHPCSLVLGDDVYEGKTRRVVVFVNPPGGGIPMKERMTAAEVASFSERMRARAKGLPEPDRVPQDDLPF